MFKNIIFLSLGYWGMYFLIINTPSLQSIYSEDFAWEVLDSPLLILRLSTGFIIGVFGYSISVVTIFENWYSMLKSRKRLDFEIILHFLAFFISYLLLFLQHQWIISICFLLSCFLGSRTFFNKKIRRF